MAVAKFGYEHAEPVVHYLTRTVTFADNGTTIPLGVLPENATVLDAVIYVGTAFNAGTTNTINVGVTGTAGAFMSAVAVGTTGRKFDATTMNAATLKSASERTATVGVVLSGTAATTGVATVVLTYIPNKR